MDRPRQARDIMITRLVTLSPETDVLDGIGVLLRNNVSGAPVLGDDRDYKGVFSEKSCLQVFLDLTSRALERCRSESLPHVGGFMIRRLVTMAPEMDGLKAVGLLLRNHISGAPVVDSGGRYLGVFSERTSMKALLDCAYDWVPACTVRAYMDTDPGRVITPEASLLDAIRLFLSTPYRRLPIVVNDHVLGQISRRDTLRAADRYVSEVMAQQGSLNGDALFSEDGSAGVGRPSIGAFMDRGAQTISPDMDLLRIATIFSQTTYRRLPVLDAGNLVGQISRRDLLQAIHDLVRKTESPHQVLLYLSSVHDPAKEGNIPIQA